MKPNDLIAQLTSWISETAPSGHNLLVPVSGGSDSALCFWLCHQAVPGRVKAVYCGQDLRERPWFEALGSITDVPEPPLGLNPEVARWAQFQLLSLQEQTVLVGTRNRTEDLLGTFSLASRVASFLPVVGVWKSDIMAMCRAINMPASIITSSKKADPACGRPAKLAAISFDQVDGFLKAKLGEPAGSKAAPLMPKQHDYLEQLYQQNDFKHQLPTCGPVAAL